MIFSPLGVVTFFLACVLGFEVAPHVGLVSKQAGTAMRIAGALFALDVGWPFVTMVVPGGELVWVLVPALLAGGAWFALAWGIVATVASAGATRELR